MRLEQPRRDGPAIRTVFNCVVHNIINHLHKLIGINFDP